MDKRVARGASDTTGWEVGEVGGPVGKWMEWVVVSGMGFLSRCICAMGGYGDMGIGRNMDMDMGTWAWDGMGHGGALGGGLVREVHAYVCMLVRRCM